MAKRIIKVGLCLMQGSKVLLARSEGDAHFQIPGGKIEPGETDLHALVREAREELSVAVQSETANHLGTFKAPAAGRPGMVVEVRLYAADVTGAPRASAEIAELHWQDVNAEPVPLSDVVRQHILPFLANRISRGGQ